MTTYKDILNSDYFKNCYTLIEELKKDYPVNHGFIHVNHVIENAKNLSKLFNLTEKETNLLLIACCLHDIGYINGREDHAKTGAVLAKDYLTKNSDLNNADIDLICGAIASHGGSEISDYKDKISLCLIFADKLDYLGTRYKNVESTALYRTIVKTELVKTNGVYQLNFYSTLPDFENQLKTKSPHINNKLLSVLDKFSRAWNVKTELIYKQLKPKTDKNFVLNLE